MLSDPVRTCTLAKGEILFEEGAKSKAIYIVTKGQLGVFKRNLKTKAKSLIAIISENQIVGEMAFIDESPRSASVEAIEPAEVLEIDSSGINRYMAKQPAWLKVIIETLVAKIRATNQKIE